MTRRHDPQRRDHIIDSCLDVIAAVGVAGASHRKVAAAADVPLGSMTYHFDGMAALLQAAFERFSDEVATRFERRLAAAVAREDAIAAVHDIVAHDVFGTPRELVLTHELYTLAAREPAFRQVTNRWMRRSRAALERHFDPATAAMLDAMIEGLTIHSALDVDPPDPDLVAAAVDRITRLG